MRILGYVLLVVGFLWLAEDAAIGFTDYQYGAWIGYSKTKLPPGDPVTRRDAIGVMRELSQDLKDRHRVVLLPGCLMFAGGLIVGAAKKREIKP